MTRTHKPSRAAVVAVLVGLLASACAEGSAEDGSASDTGCTVKIAAMGALSGENASVVLPSVNGAQLALEQWTNDECDLTLERFDTQGDPEKAVPIAKRIAEDDAFIGLVGGAWSGETRATKQIFDDAGLTMISQSATATDLTQEDQVAVFHRVVPYDDYQGAAIARYLTDELDARRVFVVDNSEAYGEPLADRVEEALGGAMVQRDKTEVGQTDFGPTISAMRSARPDAVFYGGYIAEAAPLIKQMRAAGVDAPFIGGDGLHGADFGKAVGTAGEGAIVMCPCAPIEVGGAFAADFTDAFGTPPDVYAAEGYDAMSVFLAALDDGARTRAEVEAFVDGYTGEGLSKEIAFDENGDVPQEHVSYWAYENRRGVLVAETEIFPTQ